MVFSKRDRILDKIDGFDRRLSENLATLETETASVSSRFASGLESLPGGNERTVSCSCRATSKPGGKRPWGDLADLQQSYRVRLEAIQAEAQHERGAKSCSG